MFYKKEEIKPEILDHMKGGEKYVQKYSALSGSNFTPNADIVAQLVLIPGASIGYHEHVGNEEVITVLSGTCECTDDGEIYPMKAGDVTICREHHKHGIVNNSDQDLVLMAVVIKTA